MKTKKTKTLTAIKTTLLSSSIALMMGNMAYANDDYKTVGDLEIYQGAEGGSTVVTMMLDISGSMQASDTPGCVTEASPGQRVNAVGGSMVYHLKDSSDKIVNEITRADGTKVDTSKGVTLPFMGCNNIPARRIDLLKKAMMDLVQKEGTLPNVKLGVGTFPTPMSVLTGRMAIPAKELTPEHRWDILNFIATTNTVGATPSAVAYVEAGAYMLGTKTANLGDPKKLIYTVGRSRVLPSSDMQLLSCGSAALERWVSRNGVPVREDLKPVMVTINGESIPWHTCNDGTNANFPPINHDQVTQAGEGQARFGYLNKLNFGLFPKFEYLAKDLVGARPAIKTAANTDKSDASGNYFRMGNNQLATIGYDFGRLITYRESNVANAGFPYSELSTKKADGNSYQSPIGTVGSQCDGYGIYFLTDGEPNMASSAVLTSANMSLNKTGEYAPHVTKAEFPDGVGNAVAGRASGYWNFIASYAKDLREGKNPLKANIRTATVGFGGVFNGASDNTTTKLVDGKEQSVTDCDRISKQDAKNLCKWGEKGWGYGEGGFLATSEAVAVTNSVIKFAKELNHTIPTAPAGTISIPRDPLSANSIQPYAYLPMVQPEMKKAVSTWEGNLKKYHTVNGTLYGKGASAGAVGERLYKTHDNATEGNGNFPFALNPNAEDLWQKEVKQKDNTPVSVGGTRSQLAHPSADKKTNVRSVFVETTVNGARTLQKVGTDGTRLIDFDKLGAEYTVLDKAYILNFLGYNVPVEENAYPNATTATEANRQLTAKLSTATFHSKAMLGGVLHSTPTLASYSGELDAKTGNITSDESKRSDFLLYGSMDGALHMVSARTGAESFAFIPRKIFTEQPHALRVDNEKGKIGEPKFGVDAPWQTDAEYTFSTINSVTGMRANKMFAYGGLRMGGVGLYGLNISPDTNGNINPTLAFSIDENTSGFSRLGQTWTKPVVALIKTGTGPRSASNTKRVLFVSGGYDMCYENPAFRLGADNTDTNCANKDMAKGNAVYMIDADNGTLLQTWTATTTSTSGIAATTGDGRQHMKHSIVAEVTPLDRNSNGFVDSIYFADLGGQIFRIDLQEEASATSDSLTRRVVRVFDSNAGISGAHLPYRFYDKPIVSFYNQPNGRIALVNIATGDRSSPLHKRRALEDANRIYGIIDRDLATPAISSGRGLTGLISKDLTNAMLTHHNPATLNPDVAKESIGNLSSGKTQGWYYDMNRYADRIGIKNLKSVGPGAVIGSIYYASVYSPEYSYSNKDACSATIAGGTERQGYCLPWGVCANPKTGALSTTNGTVGYTKVGPGIQELAIATLTDKAGNSRNVRTLIGTQTFDERIEAKAQGYSGGANDPFDGAEVAGNKNAKGTNPIEGGNASATNKVLKVKRWYDLQTAEDDQ